MKNRDRKNRMVIRALLFAMLLVFAMPQTAAAAKKTGLREIQNKLYFYVTKKETLKNKFKTIKGKTYYFKKDGAAATGLVKIKKAKYYFDKQGVMQTGWQKIGKKYAYFKKKTGKMARNTMVGGVKIKANGYAVFTKLQKKQRQAEEKAKEIVDSITQPGMSQSEKLRACWNYMVSKNNFYYIRKDFTPYEGWQYDYAYIMLTGKGGNCYNFACAFAMLAKAVGYEPYVLRGMVPHNGGGTTPHCLVKIKGLYYDPEAQWAGWATGIYGSLAYPMFLSIHESRKI